MSESHLDVVRRFYDGWGAGDFSVGADDLDPHVCFVVNPPFPEPAVLVGPEAISSHMLKFLKQFEASSHSISATSLEAIGDTVLVEVNQHAIGRSSGITSDLGSFMLFTFRGGKVVRMESILDEEAAFRAAGLHR